MKIPLEINVAGMEPSEAVEAKIRQRALGLERYSRRIGRCEVWLKTEHGHHRKGPFYAVRVRLTVPNEEILVDFQPAQDDVYVAIRQAFDAARRELEDAERGRPGHTRGHEQRRRRPGPGSPRKRRPAAAPAAAEAAPPE
jgi:ribosome-associated translation inhibitor RaiA